MNIDIVYINAAAKLLYPDVASVSQTEDGTLSILNNAGDALAFSSSELEAEALLQKDIGDSKQYARDRAEAYPSLQEQADMAYWDRQNGTTTLDDAISAVKLQFPKG